MMLSLRDGATLVHRQRCAHKGSALHFFFRPWRIQGLTLQPKEAR